MSKLRDDILKQHNPSVRRRAELEYDVVSALIREARKNGFELDSVASDDIEPVRSREQALRLVFNLDECTLRFRRGDKLVGAYLVFGNDGWDLVSDYSSDGGEDLDNPTPGSFAEAVERATKPFADRYG